VLPAFCASDATVAAEARRRFDAFVADPAGAEGELPSEYQQAVYKLVRSTYISIYIKYIYKYTSIYIHIYAAEARRQFDAFVADPAGAEGELPSEYQQAVYKLVRSIYIYLSILSIYIKKCIYMCVCIYVYTLRRIRCRSGRGRGRAAVGVPTGGVQTGEDHLSIYLY